MDQYELLELLGNLENIEDDDERYTALFRAFGEIYQSAMAELDNDDFEVDPEGMQHFTEFASFITHLAKENNWRVELDLHEPKECIAGINVYFPLFWLTEGMLREFCKRLVWASAMSIDPLTDGTVCLSVRFAGVYRKKQGD